MDKIMGFLPFMLECTVVTVEIFVLTLVISLPLGLPVALGSNSRIKPLSILCKTYVWIFRGTPLLLQLFFFYYFFPLVLDIKGMNVFVTVLLTFVLNYAAYFAEIYRGGINSIDIGQYEAAHSLGLSRRQTMMDIIMPQTMKAILPPVVNEAITLVKDTSLARIIALQEIIWAGQAFMKGSQGISGAIWPLFFTAVYYLIFNGVLTVLLGQLEKKLDYFR